MYWSKAIYTMPKARIILTKEKLEQLNNAEEISIKELLKNEIYRFGAIKSAKHYPFDINNYKDQNNIYTISSSSPLTHLLKMMKKDRIDWIFDHPVFVTWDAILNNRNGDKFRTIKISEYKKRITPLHIFLVEKMHSEKKS